MKKYAVIANIGNYNSTSIECAVKDVELVADSDNREELVKVLVEKAARLTAARCMQIMVNGTVTAFRCASTQDRPSSSMASCNKHLTNLGLDKSPRVCYNKYNEMRER